jgi:hypothetical protein
MAHDNCFKCHKSIQADHVVLKFDDNIYHSGCFTCAECHIPLGGVKFIRHATLGRLCLECDDRLSIKCEKCNKGFKPGESFKKMNSQNCEKCFHTECFTCSLCGHSIPGQFYDCRGSIVCIDCQKKKEEANMKYCAHCRLVIKYKFLVYKSEPYHPACFKCKVCAEPIESASFYQVEDKEPVCDQCNQKYLEKTADVCTKCSKPILDTGVQFENLHFHNTCLTCMSCHCVLENIVFTNSDETYCERCYSEKYAKKCDKCQQKISHGDTCAIFAEKYFHKKCFMCSKCGTSIAEVQFVKRDSRLVCVSCK